MNFSCDFLFQKRDLGVSFVFVALTYFIIGGLFYLVFPLDKSCIQDVSLAELSHFFVSLVLVQHRSCTSIFIFFFYFYWILYIWTIFNRISSTTFVLLTYDSIWLLVYLIKRKVTLTESFRNRYGLSPPGFSCFFRWEQFIHYWFIFSECKCATLLQNRNQRFSRPFLATFSLWLYAYVFQFGCQTLVIS